MKDFINIQDGTGATHVIFTRHITNLTLHGGSARIHINSGGSSVTVQTKLSIKEVLDIITDKPQDL
jgi:hypothetical protein